MPVFRTRPLLAVTAMLLGLAHAGHAQRDVSPNYPRRILAGPDTIWFVPELPDEAADRSRRSLGFVVATREWVEARLPRERASLATGTWRLRPAGAGGSGTVVGTVRPGLSLVVLGDTVVQRASRWPAKVYGVHDQATSRTVRLVVPQTWRPRQIDRPDDPTSRAGDYATEPTTWLVAGDEAYFGLWAGPPSTDRTAAARQLPVPAWKGGLLVLDTRTLALKPLLHEALEDHRVTALAVAGDALWIGTDRLSLEGRAAVTGLLRYRPSDGAWVQYSSSFSPLPSNTIVALRGMGSLLAIVTDSGAAVFDAENDLWSARYLADDLRRDTLTWAASATRSRHDSVMQASRLLAEVLQEPRGSALLHAARRARREPLVALLRAHSTTAPRDHDGALVDGAFDAMANALADTAFLPFLAHAIARSDGERRLLASEALVRIDHSRARSLVAAMLDTAAVERAVHLAGRLAQRGDERGRRWIRAKLADSLVLGDTGFVFAGEGMLTRLDTLVETVVALADTALVSSLLHALDTRSALRAIRATVATGALRHQRALAAAVEKRPWLWAPYLEQFVPGETGSEATPALPFVNDRTVRTSVSRVARIVLNASDSALTRARLARPEDRRRAQASAVEALVRFAQTPAIPYLIAVMESPTVELDVVTQGLVRLTGLASAPVARGGTVTMAQRQGIHGYWRQWWSRHQAGFVPPRPEDSDRALADWRARRPRG